MTILDALRHQWMRQWRSTTFGRSLIAGLFLLLAAVYFGGLFVTAGWFYPQVVAEVAPKQEPLRLLNEVLLYGAIGLVPMRFFLQRSAGSDVRPYLHLPLRRPQVVRIMQVLSSLSLLNLLPVVVLAALWGSTVRPATSAMGAACWAVGALLLVATTQFLNSLLRAVWDQRAGLVLGAAGLLAVVVAAGYWTGGGMLRALSAWLFGGLAATHIAPLLVLLGTASGMAWAAHRALRGRLDSVLEDAGRTRGQPGALLRGRGRGWGRVASLALLDLKLILRNKRPRQMLLLGVFLIAVFSLGVVEDDMEVFNEVVFGFLLSGYLGLMYGQFGYAWHGRHFDQFVLSPVSSSTLIRAQFLTVAGLCTVPLLIVGPIVAVLAPSLLETLTALLVYNLGVTAPALILMAMWRREAIELDQTAFFNYQGTSSGSFLYGALGALVVMGLPLALAVGVGLGPTLLVVAGLGALGLGTAPFWTRGLGRLLHRQRHALAAGFRDE
ncbi:MAG: DUF5687 family protein [Salinibacter sp.]|uniref:DUF5687 family protein n=1 Tax=Salinibacter sp. TaxID=2065818 RepID=UPI0035D42644